jgi:nucleotide-binding universal stress UspA family protein
VSEEGGTPFLAKLLVGVDGSPDAERAIGWAARLAATSGAEVVVVHVLTFDRELVRDASLDTMTTWRQDLRRDLGSTWVATLLKRGTKHRCELVEAPSAAIGILEVAEREDVDLIIIGPRHHNIVADRLLGSTASRLTHHSTCPVAFVPQHDLSHDEARDPGRK